MTITAMSSTPNDAKKALLKAYAHAVRSPHNDSGEDLISDCGHGRYDDWFEIVEKWLDDHSSESGDPETTLIAAWAAHKRAFQANGDEKDKKCAKELWLTGKEYHVNWDAAITAWEAANPELAPA